MLKMFRNTVYIRLKADKISLLHVDTGKEISMIPELAIETLADGNKQMLVFGNNAKDAEKSKPNVALVNGFKHPRTLLADFIIAEQTLKACLKLLIPKSIFQPSPVIIFQPLEMDEGGYTQVEMRAFQELCNQAGARKVYIKLGAELSEDDLIRIADTGKYEH
jgi:rod shape-determining protein MreB and related proteins